MRVGFAGMTHLGINSVAAAAARGFSVLAYDPDEALIGKLRSRELPVTEPGLDELLARHEARLVFSSVPADLETCDIVYISGDVPTDGSGKSDLAPIRRLVDQAAANMRRNALLVVLCQVPPGFTRALRCVPPHQTFYQVETLIFGRAVERALAPERIIVGCADPERPLPTTYQALLEAFGCPILPMRYESAELAKISINFCLVGSIAVANTLAEVSEMVGADWSEIVPALRLDKRIGPHAYLTPGLGLAGGNLERDLRTVLDLADGKDADVGVVRAWIANSDHRRDWCWLTLDRRVLARAPDAQIAVLGLAYKENTHSTKNSPALALLSRLAGKSVNVHDPVVPTSIVPFARGHTDPMACISGADAVVIATPWPIYRSLSVAKMAGVMRGRILIDPFRVVNGREAVEAGFEYHALGAPALGLTGDHD